MYIDDKENWIPFEIRDEYVVDLDYVVELRENAVERNLLHPHMPPFLDARCAFTEHLFEILPENIGKASASLANGLRIIYSEVGIPRELCGEFRVDSCSIHFLNAFE